MTIQEAIILMKRTRDNDPFVGTPYCNEKRKAYETAIKSLEAWEKVNEDIDRLARRPCINQNMMAQNIAYKEVKNIIKKHLAEAKGDKE